MTGGAKTVDHLLDRVTTDRDRQAIAGHYFAPKAKVAGVSICPLCAARSRHASDIGRTFDLNQKQPEENVLLTSAGKDGE